LDQLVDISQSSGVENTIFAIIGLLKLGQKSGLLFNTWNENFSIGSFKFLDFLKLMNCALRNSNETVRAEAFAVVCISSKTCSIPSLKEFELVHIFLLENVNIDSASLRQAILNSFALFITRICDSSIHELKVKERTQIPKQYAKGKKNLFSNSEENKEMDVTQISQNIQFLNWLHHFLISNLETGANYQRKILSLQLYMLVLSHFSKPAERTKGSCGLRSKRVALKGEAVMKYALQLGKWPFHSESSHKTLLNCVLDPTDDIRETAGLILITYFDFKEPKIEENISLLDYALRLCTSPMFYEMESGALLMKVLGNWTYKMSPKKSDELTSIMVSTKCSESLTRSRRHCSNLMLYNQQKLLAGLYNKRNKCVHNKSEGRRDTKVETKEKMGTFLGLHVMHPSLLKDTCSIELSDESQIFEGLTVVSRDGLVGQCTTSGTDKSRCLSDRQTYSGVDSSNNTIHGDKQKSLPYNKRNKNETTLDLQDSHTSLKYGVEFCASSQYKLHPLWLDSEDLGKVWHKSASEVTSPQSTYHIQSVFEGQVEQDTWDRHAGKEQEAHYQSDVHISSVSFTSARRLKFSRKGKKLKNLCKNKQDTDFHPLHTGSGNRGHDSGIDSHQNSKEFCVPQYKVQHQSVLKGFYAYKQNMKPDNGELFLYEDWNLWSSIEPSEKKNFHKCESNVDTCRYEQPFKNNQKELGTENAIQQYNGSAPLSFFLLTKAEAELSSLRGDLFLAAFSGSPLHGTITALIRLATQPDGPECGCMSAEEVDRTVTLLEQTVSFFLDFLATKSASTAGNQPFLLHLGLPGDCF
jgi:hypothetical protein